MSGIAEGERGLIVNADDFGQSPGVNRGVAVAHERGIVTSASLMVRHDEAAAASRYAAVFALPLGLHVDLGEWAFRHGAWTAVYEVVDLEDADAVWDEVRRQAGAFVDLVGRLPTHIDSHQHVHRRETVRAAVEALARDLDAPLRHRDPRVRHCGAFYGQTAEGEPLPDAISVDALVTILDDLPAGVTELACHPAAEADLDTMYRAERVAELTTLCDERVRAVIDAQGIRLTSFASLLR